MIRCRYKSRLICVDNPDAQPCGLNCQRPCARTSAHGRRVQTPSIIRCPKNAGSRRIEVLCVKARSAHSQIRTSCFGGPTTSPTGFEPESVCHLPKSPMGFGLAEIVVPSSRHRRGLYPVSSRQWDSPSSIKGLSRPGPGVAGRPKADSGSRFLPMSQWRALLSGFIRAGLSCRQPLFVKTEDSRRIPKDAGRIGRARSPYTSLAAASQSRCGLLVSDWRHQGPKGVRAVGLVPMRTSSVSPGTELVKSSPIVEVVTAAGG